MTFSKDMEFTHINCLQWMTDIWYADEFKYSIRRRDSKLFPQLKKGAAQTCFYCHGDPSKNQEGTVCIKCDHRGCNTYFHVRCAIKHKLIRSSDEMNELYKSQTN